MFITIISGAIHCLTKVVVGRYRDRHIKIFQKHIPKLLFLVKGYSLVYKQWSKSATTVLEMVSKHHCINKVLKNNSQILCYTNCREAWLERLWKLQNYWLGIWGYNLDFVSKQLTVIVCNSICFSWESCAVLHCALQKASQQHVVQMILIRPQSFVPAWHYNGHTVLLEQINRLAIIG